MLTLQKQQSFQTISEGLDSIFNDRSEPACDPRVGYRDPADVCASAAQIVSPAHLDFFKHDVTDGPVLAVSREQVRAKFRKMKAVMPGGTRIMYAMKANDHPDILDLIIEEGGQFDCASDGEIAKVYEAAARVGFRGNPGELCSFGNTNKREAQIVSSYAQGVRLFVADYEDEIEKIARAAPGSQVFIRISLLETAGTAAKAFSNKFGCSLDKAVDLTVMARDLGLVPIGFSVHVGGQQRDVNAYAHALKVIADLFQAAEARGVETMSFVNLGGGFPGTYNEQVPDLDAYGRMIREKCREHFGRRNITVAIEPGRGMLADAGVIRCTVVNFKRPERPGDKHMLITDVGKFSGLYEVTDEKIHYRFARDGGDEAMVECEWLDDSCDSSGVNYKSRSIWMPADTKPSDDIYISSTGAYTVAYCMPGFNSLPPVVCKVF
ncbi:MAG: hypothetical protein ABW063_00665 [Caulobacter sp.]